MEAESASSKGHAKVDMVPETIEQRRDMVSVLHDLGKHLQTARSVKALINQPGNSHEGEPAQ
jgi:hypothetical protein